MKNISVCRLQSIVALQLKQARMNMSKLKENTNGIKNKQ